MKKKRFVIFVASIFIIGGLLAGILYILEKPCDSMTDLDEIADHFGACVGVWKSIGIIAKIATLLSENQIPVFVISTYNTDYILVKKENKTKTIEILSKSGYKILK